MLSIDGIYIYVWYILTSWNYNNSYNLQLII